VTAPAPVELHPEAIEEARAARLWYAERSPLAAAAFVAELDWAVAAIGEAPARWPRHLGEARRFVMRRFPFTVLYSELQDRVEVVAVAHTKRRPGYWKHRLRNP
jgi:plasmid stabilization system protein ParE